METLADILKQKSSASPLMRGVKTAMVLEEANGLLLEIFGESITDRARALCLKNKIITMACLSSVLAQEIRLNEKRILKELNTKFGQATVEKLRYLS